MSSPAPYTMLHLAAASYSPNGSKTAVEDAYNFVFRKYEKNAEYPSAIWGDKMLNNTQRRSDHVQAIAVMTYLQVALSAGVKPDKPAEAAAGTPEPNPSQRSEATPLSFKEMQELLDQIRQTEVADSPFDYLDRATDFYTAAVIKNIRRSPDTRTQDANTLAAQLDWSAVPQAGGYGPLGETSMASSSNPTTSAVGKDWRQIMLYVQVHVEPGSRPNYMAGLRAKLVRAVDQAGNSLEGERLRQAVQIVRAHPTRAYDLDDAVFAEQVDEAMSTAANLAMPILKAKGIDASVNTEQDRRLRAEARRRFLTRISKHGSFVDSDRMIFGWNFYPTNLEVVEHSFLRQFAGWFVGPPTKYAVEAYLEPGGRDCAIFLTVDSRIRFLEFETYHVSQSVDRTGLNRGYESHVFTGNADQRRESNDGRSSGRTIVTLPAYDARESIALWMSGDGQIVERAKDQLAADRNSAATSQGSGQGGGGNGRALMAPAE